MFGVGAWYVLPMAITSLLGLVGTITGGILTYRATRRTTSGTVQTSNANELWQENSRLIERLGKEIDRMGKQIDDLQADVRTLRAERDELRRENMVLRDEQAHLNLQIERLRNRSSVNSIVDKLVPVVDKLAASADDGADAVS